MVSQNSYLSSLKAYDFILCGMLGYHVFNVQLLKSWLEKSLKQKYFQTQLQSYWINGETKQINHHPSCARWSEHPRVKCEKYTPGNNLELEVCEIWRVWDFFFFLFSHAWGLQKFPGQGLNMSHSSDDPASWTARLRGNSLKILNVDLKVILAVKSRRSLLQQKLKIYHRKEVLTWR